MHRHLPGMGDKIVLGRKDIKINTSAPITNGCIVHCMESFREWNGEEHLLSKIKLRKYTVSREHLSHAKVCTWCIVVCVCSILNQIPVSVCTAVFVHLSNDNHSFGAWAKLFRRRLNNSIHSVALYPRRLRPGRIFFLDEVRELSRQTAEN